MPEDRSEDEPKHFGDAFLLMETESVDAYVHRMRTGPLPNWPDEVLAEWLFRHNNQLEDYAWLDFTSFEFRRVAIPRSELPARECFRHGSLCDTTSRKVVLRLENANYQRGDWLLDYMMAHGTWPVPIVLLANPMDDMTLPGLGRIRSPWHLLEGHRRLSLMRGLIEREIANDEHLVWVVSLPRSPHSNPVVLEESKRLQRLHELRMANTRAPSAEVLELQGMFEHMSADELRALELELTAVADLSPAPDDPAP